MPIDHDHSYKFYDERPENRRSHSPRIEAKECQNEGEVEEEEEYVDVSQNIDNYLYLVQVLDATAQERATNLSHLSNLLRAQLKGEMTTLTRFLPTINRLSVPGLCPLIDVQCRMGQIMGEIRLKEKADPSTMRALIPRLAGEVSPSRFFKITYNPVFDFDERMTQFFTLADSDDFRQNLAGGDLRKLLLAETWNQFHRIDNLSLILASHPTYFDFWRKFHGALIFNETENDGLSRIEKIYIAIMAASASKSTYLYYLLVNEFKSDPDFHARPEKFSVWIDVGYDKIPQKMRDLCELNEKMVTCPWLINPDQITKLTHRAKDQWRLSELIQAVLIMAWIHANAVFCFGIGINPEIDASRKFSNHHAQQQQQQKARKSEAKKMRKSDSEISIDIQDTVVQTDSDDEADDATCEKLRTRMAMISRIRTESETRQDIDEQEMQAKNLENFRKLKDQPGTFSSDHESDSDEQFNQEMFLHLSPSYRLSRNHQQPMNNNNMLNEDTELRLQEFNWKSKTVPCALDIIGDQLRRIDNDLVYLLDEKFNHIQSLTYHKIGKEPVDTEIFRHGVWNFAHCRLGIMSSECNYDHLERLLLDDDWRRYLEKIMKSHHDITRTDYNHFCTGLENDEKVHVNLLCLEARFQAELLYTMRCFSLCTI